MKRGLTIGLTGGMACGKSTVAAVWKSLGAHVIDSDATVHRLLAEDAEIQQAVGEAFGAETRREDGKIDRAALAAIVFNDEAALRRLTDILHPKTRAYHVNEARRITHGKPDSAAVIDSPLLFESGLDAQMDVTVVVGSSLERQVERALARALAQGTTLTRADIQKRIALQMPLDEKRRRADCVIENDGTIEALRGAAVQLYRALTAKFQESE